MAEAVAEAIAKKHHLLVEAGTGVGKSFAYLVPAILAATAEWRRRREAQANCHQHAYHRAARAAYSEGLAAFKLGHAARVYGGAG